MSRAGVIILFLGSLLLFALGLPAAGTVQDQPSTPAHTLRIDLTVTDARQPRMYVTGLVKDQITVLVENVPQEVTSLDQSEQPMSIGLVFDTSRAHYISRGAYSNLLASTKEAFLAFVKSSGTGNQYFVAGFDGETYLAADWASTSGRVAEGFDRLAGVKPQKRTALYDALHSALVKVGGGAHRKRLIILISDGRDNGSKLKSGELFDALRRSDALVYAIAVTSHGVMPSYVATLNKLCSVTGGLGSYPSTEAEFYESFERLLVELKHQYTVSFTPRNVGAKGGWRRLSYKAKTLDFKGTPAAGAAGKMPLAVRGREGYFDGP